MRRTTVVLDGAQAEEECGVWGWPPWALAAEDGHAEVARDAREAVDAPRLLTSERDKPYLRSSDRRSGDARRGEGVCALVYIAAAACGDSSEVIVKERSNAPIV